MLEVRRGPCRPRVDESARWACKNCKAQRAD
jgi:hypothetical protein